jgi:hypothetical protein
MGMTSALDGRTAGLVSLSDEGVAPCVIRQ